MGVGERNITKYNVFDFSTFESRGWFSDLVNSNFTNLGVDKRTPVIYFSIKDTKCNSGFCGMYCIDANSLKFVWSTRKIKKIVEIEYEGKLWYRLQMTSACCFACDLSTHKRRVIVSRWTAETTLREILLVVLTKRSQLYIFSKRYQKFCKTYQYLKVDGTTNVEIKIIIARRVFVFE